MKATNIKWDTDGEYVSGLPTEVVIPDNVDPEDVADWLSDTYGFCIFSYEEKPMKTLYFEGAGLPGTEKEYGLNCRI